MNERGISLQDAYDHVGDLFKTWYDVFKTAKQDLDPTYKSSETVQRYISAMEDWVVGHLHWSFKSGRCFGSKGEEVRESLLVHFTPRTSQSL